MNTLRIRFSGLCMFGFNASLRNGGPRPTEARVLLPKLTRAHQLQNVVNGKNEILDQHFPLLEFDLSSLALESTRKPDFHCRPTEAGTMTRGVCLLFGEDLKIKSDVEVEPLRFDKDEPRERNWRRASKEDKGTLWWLASFEDAFPEAGHGTIRREFYENPPGPNEAILARIVLTQGRLKTAAITDETCIFLEPGALRFRQPVATALELELPFDKRIKITLTRQENGEEKDRTLELVPTGGNLEIEIKNAEIDEVIGIERRYVGRRPEADYEVYAELSEDLPPGASIPIVRKISPSTGSGVHGSVCPPTAGVIVIS